MTAASNTLSKLQKLWLTETIRLREEHTGPLEDSETNRRVQVAGGDFVERLQHRALLLAERDGQLQALSHWRQGSRLAFLAMLVLAVFSGIGLSVAALGDGLRPVNVFWALGSMLGLNLLMLIGWLLGLFFTGESAGALGRLWLWLSEKLARDAQVAQLAPALLILLQRQRLSRWALGIMSNGFWLVALLSTLLSMLLLLATRRYGFVWESTILSGETFTAVTQSIGALPALFGFSLPDAELIRISGDNVILSEAARQSWAGWLVGVLLVYGIIPRLVLTLVCWLLWSKGRAALKLDTSLPGYSLLRERLQPSSERIGVNDSAPDVLHQPATGYNANPGEEAVLMAIELDAQRQWPPTKLPKSVRDAGVIDTREQRQRLLEQLTRFPPARLLIACDPRRSPDRGALGLLGELSRCAGTTRIWLLPPPTDETLDGNRLSDWHKALDALQLTHSDSAPLTWLESGHD
ncbi:DUF2868 domain-containing protein [Pseudomonas sp. M30-35]|uniref:DUF2868 domain-containing protein n=1 Tax=Pseudomonas sp. M30-35 TaxID=1981174 RepID=UPI000B3BFCB4|nr:DUF2868 domain-containing protein [Pseudomonas sp. M30-35]ARU86802.1 hypothetical protein B9K09_01820 [Pseudomonas sp. M30-35]